jgi:hypothetical protein
MTHRMARRRQTLNHNDYQEVNCRHQVGGDGIDGEAEAAIG